MSITASRSLYTQRYPTSHYIILKLTRGVFIVCLFYINFTRFYPVSVDAIISTHIFCTVTPIDLFFTRLILKDLCINCKTDNFNKVPQYCCRQRWDL